MNEPTYPIKYTAPDGHVLTKAHVNPAQSAATGEGVVTQNPSAPYPLQNNTQPYPLGG